MTAPLTDEDLVDIECAIEDVDEGDGDVATEYMKKLVAEVRRLREEMRRYDLIHGWDQRERERNGRG